MLGQPTHYKTDSSGWYTSTALYSSASPIGSCTRALGLDGNHFELSQITGIRRFALEHLNNVNRVLQCVKKAGGHSQAGKWTSGVPEVVAVGHRCTYEDVTPRIARFSEDYRWPDCNTSHSGSRFLGRMWVVRILGQRFCEMCEAPHSLDKEGHRVCLGHRSE